MKYTCWKVALWVKLCSIICCALRKSKSPQHRCHTCGVAVSTICHCNTQDLNSSNEQHRVHRHICAGLQLTCKLCGKVSKSEEALKCHTQTIHPTCIQCGIVAKSVNELKFHTQAVHPELICKQCGKVARSEQTLKCHTKAIHPAYECTECNDKFNNLDAYQIHMKIHELSKRPVRTKKRRIAELEEEPESLDDSVVDKDFSPEENQENDDDEGDFKCPQCDFTSYWEKDVKQHMQWNHRIERRQEKKTNQPSRKKKKIQDTKKKSIACEKCGKTFTQNWNLARHVNNKSWMK